MLPPFYNIVKTFLFGTDVKKIWCNVLNKKIIKYKRRKSRENKIKEKEK